MRSQKAQVFHGLAELRFMFSANHKGPRLDLWVKYYEVSKSD